MVLAALPVASVGAGVRIRPRNAVPVTGEVVTFDGLRAAVAPYGSVDGVAAGDRVELDETARSVPLGYGALGRALGANGEPLDGAGRLSALARQTDRLNLAPTERSAVVDPLWTGVPAIDGLLTIGRGARIGVFGAPGAGKTTLLDSIAAHASADAVVLALIGERGREAHAWLQRRDDRMTIVCATSDRTAAERIRAADVALAQAQFLRQRGLHVMLIVDSLARYCAALREQRIANGEAVGRGGYPPSVWADLARFVEGAGNATTGSITLLATVLSDGADEREPLTDAARSLLDGHVALSAVLGRAGRFPAIDILGSASRTMDAVADAEQRAAARVVRGTLALLDSTREARELGLGEMTPALTSAVAEEEKIEAFLRRAAPCQPSDTRDRLRVLARRITAH